LRFELDVEPLFLLVERRGFEAFGAPGAPGMFSLGPVDSWAQTTGFIPHWS
jgi:hypothetical protein